MITWPRLFLSYVFASLFCLGVYLYNPIQTPKIPVRPVDVKAELQRELQQKEVHKATIEAASIYRRYGCSVELAGPTAEKSVKYQVHPKIATAVVITESSCNERAFNRKSGASGLMQIMPHMHHISRKEVFDREKNLDKGMEILSGLVHTYGNEEGVARYFGITPGSNAAWDYEFRVMQIAGYRGR